MRPDWRRTLERWQAAGLIDAEASGRIVAFETHEARPARLEWPVALALILGGIAIGAGLLLLVAANWDRLSPNTRFGPVILLAAIFHLAGAASSRDSQAFAAALHGIGTLALGAGLVLSAQIYNLPVDMPALSFLWALGAVAGWILLRDAIHLAMSAVLVPAWLAAQFLQTWPSGGSQIVDGLLLLAVVYLGQLTNERKQPWRLPLAYIGGIGLLPLGVIAAIDWKQSYAPETFALALLPGLALGIVLLRKDAWIIGLAAVWIAVLRELTLAHSFLVYLWCAAGSVALIAWGWRDGRKERINLGVACFAVSVLCFYVSNVLDRLGRSASLIAIGVFLLAGGWALERLRRRLVAHV